MWYARGDNKVYSQSKRVRLGGTTLETRFIDMMNLSGSG
ncbi:hypothetical protein CPS_3881 [Colwellia psychrerythraea 34H]|uniref:Uncharacterized protein n=1 Tax=Colwellia psychrerythraea (strain 34H / ATCC BAA-681) TaxID=167879 RepID=Q47XC7_COLP3|nr:hypothetical protein CPS_3881 [Colwellia psychrerythraea 34H]